MNVKKIAIPAIIASQLMGCAAVSQSELLQMINNAEEIEIEIATPINQEQGTEQQLDWTELAQLQTNPELRKAWDDILNITITDTGKNGILYVNEQGDNENNNTLRIALHNRAFQKALFEEEATQLKLAEASYNQYVDLDEEDTTKALLVGLNGYFNLLSDHDVNYSNPDSTLTRAEFMAMVMRAETKVDATLTLDATFKSAVGTNDLNLYAQEMEESAYLNLDDKSLNNMTYNGTMTRGEAIYLLMNHYFKDDLASLDVKKANKNLKLSDVKDGGDIAAEQNFKNEDGTPKDYCKSYELVYSLQNPDLGAPTSIYKALLLANEKGIIDAETRWDEGITKSEAIELLIETIKQDKTIEEFNFSQGKIAGHEAPVEADPNTVIEEAATLEGEYDERIHGEFTEPEVKEEQATKAEEEAYQALKDAGIDLSTYTEQELAIILDILEKQEPVNPNKHTPVESDSQYVIDSGELTDPGYQHGSGDYTGLEGGTME